MVTTPTRLRSAIDDAPGEVNGPTRRSYPVLAAGLLAALVGALLFATIATSFDDRQAVLVMARPVAAGAVISAGDVRTVQVSTSGSAGFVAAADRARIVGRTAAVPLLAGSLLAPTQVGSAARIEAGEAAVGLLLEPGRYPPGLHPGDHVAVVAAPTGPARAEEAAARLGRAIVEEVAAMPGAAGVTARLRLSARQSDLVAAEGAARRVALVQIAAGEQE